MLLGMMVTRGPKAKDRVNLPSFTRRIRLEVLIYP